MQNIAVKTKVMTSTIQNFQIPVLDYDRSHRFYSTLMDYELQTMEASDFKLGVFQFDQDKGVGGCIIKSEGLEPSKHGTMVYLHAGRDLQPYLDRCMKAGGNIFAEKTPLGPQMGFYAIIEDTEGNRVGLYSDQ